MKDFTDSTKIAAISTTGNVFSYKVIEELNKKQKNWMDLLTGKKFKSRDIIILQDPLNLRERIIDNFFWRREGLDLEKEEIEEDDHLLDIDMPGLGKRALEKAENSILDENVIKKLKKNPEIGVKIDKSKLDPEELLTVSEFLDERKVLKDWRHEMQTTGKMAASVTSSYIDVKFNEEKRVLTDAEMLFYIWNRVKSHHIKTYVQITTNLGILSCVLFSDQTARSCFSFLDLVYRKKLDGLKFEKMIEGTIIQVGKYGKNERFDTVDRSEKLKHDRGGLITIDSSGDLGTLGFTLAKSGQLDYNYSVFGRVVGGFEVIKQLGEMKDIESEDGILGVDFRIEGFEVISDAFQEACRGIRRELLGVSKEMLKEKKKEEKEIKRKELLDKILMI